MVNLDKCWEDFVDGIDFGDDDGQQVDPVEIDPNPPPFAPPMLVSCATVHPLIFDSVEKLALHQAHGGALEDHLDTLRVQVATCLSQDLMMTYPVLHFDKLRGDTYAMSLSDLHSIAYYAIVYAFVVADYVSQHFDG